MSMTVRVYGHLRSILGARELQIDAQNGGTLKDLLEDIWERYGEEARKAL